MAWRLAKSLIKLRDQINAVAPHRSRASDGSIGDAAHASRDSDHNPWIKDGAGIGVVSAVDITNDPQGGMNVRTLADALISDPRTKYVIFDGRIWKARTGKWEPYRGLNKHRQHLHISVQPTDYDSEASWFTLNGQPVKSQRPVLKRGDRGEAVKELQLKLRKYSDIGIDGVFGDSTERAVRYFQRLEGLTSDGIVGEKTWQKLG